MQASNFLNLSYIYQKLYELFTGQFLPGSDFWIKILLFLLALLKPVAVVLSFLFLTGIIYTTIRMRALLREAHEKEHAAHVGVHVAAGESASTLNKRWEQITHHISSANPGDWRLAILECDIILEEMLTKMGYHGETLSDKLKAVEKSDFLSIDKAWEAHRVRNAIAHGGSNFQINEREVKRVVGLYEEVFREFHYI